MQILAGNMNSKFLRVLAHVFFWVLYLMFYVVQFILFSDSPGFMNIVGRLSMSIWIDIAATYLTVYFLIPRFLLKKKYVEFLVLMLISAAGMILLQRLLVYYITYPIFSPEYVIDGRFWRFNPFYSLINIYTVVSVFASFKLLKFWYRNQQQKEELEKQNRISELTLLKSQVSPHFLFNTLNNIDSLIIKDQNSASDAVIKLSEILRFMLYEANAEWVLLEKEIFYLQSYISLQLLRIKNKDFVSFNISGDHSKLRIAPMLLIPFVENAFKHGLKNTPSPGIKINLNVSPEMINFKVVNKINTWDQGSKDQTSGIGLVNIQRRLSLIYPGLHELNIVSDASDYSVELKIKKV